MSLLQTSTLSNQNISSALLVGTFTAAQEYPGMSIEVLLKEIAGGGNYSAFLTRQPGGLGTAVPSAITTEAVPGGVTSHLFVTLPFGVNAGDVVKVYVQGLPADTATPDITCEFRDQGITTMGNGTIPFVPDRVTDPGGDPLDGVDTWINTDPDDSRVGVIARAHTNALGVIPQPWLMEAGTYWVWRQLGGYEGENPQEVTVA